MDFDLVLRLEEMVDQLLTEHRQLADENRSLRERCSGLEQERQRFRAELDRILAKFEAGGREAT